jgi:transcription elongation GreA/GreB family factor
MISPGFKTKIKLHCLYLLEQKKVSLLDSIKRVTEAANNETKSSAGDKHETSRAHMQLEQEKLSKQLNELNEQIEELSKINIDIIQNNIGKGSLVKTQSAYIFIATGIGKIQIDQETVYVISRESPLGKKIIGLNPGDKTALNETEYVIESVQ